MLKCISDSLKREKRKSYMRLIDLHKAFDSIWRTTMFYSTAIKLAKRGGSFKFLRLNDGLCNIINDAMERHQRRDSSEDEYSAIRRPVPRLSTIHIINVRRSHDRLIFITGIIYTIGYFSYWDRAQLSTHPVICLWQIHTWLPIRHRRTTWKVPPVGPVGASPKGFRSPLRPPRRTQKSLGLRALGCRCHGNHQVLRFHPQGLVRIHPGTVLLCAICKRRNVNYIHITTYNSPCDIPFCFVTREI